MSLLKYLLIVAAAGMTGTTVMTAFMLIMSGITHRQLNVIRVLGSMLTFKTSRAGTVSRDPIATAVGIIVHYFVGFLFTAIYLWLWNHDIIGTSIISTALLGFMTGLAAISVWIIFFALHPRPVRVPLTLYLTCIFIGHIFFAVCVRLALGS
ncbi:MAG TPA: hypothetical protein VK625_00275 [Flavitalea sp.]|nr:hypothetical protein [Flavitalea sp.]